MSACFGAKGLKEEHGIDRAEATHVVSGDGRAKEWKCEQENKGVRVKE